MLWTIIAYQAPLSIGFSRQEYRSGVPCLLPTLARRFPTPSATWEAPPFSSVFVAVAQSCLFVTPWTAAYQASLSFTISQSLLKLKSLESVIPSNHLILCRPLLLLPLIFPSIRVFSNKSVLCLRWPKYWSYRFSISPSNKYSGLSSFWIDWLDLLAVQGTLKPTATTTTNQNQS